MIFGLGFGSLLPTRAHGVLGMLASIGCAFSLLVTASCSRRSPPTRQRHDPALAAGVREPALGTASATATSAESAEGQACARRIAALNAEPELPGSVVNRGFTRAFLLGRGRGEPVLFLRTPQFDEQRGSSQARALRAELRDAEKPAYAFESALLRVRKSPELAREVFLTEGYLYTESAELAALYVSYLALGLLFREPELRLARGAELWTLRRRDGDYEYADGPKQGERARILLFDRVYVAGKEPISLHADVRAAAIQSLSDELRVDRLTARGALASLRFGASWLPAVLSQSGSSFGLECQRDLPALRESLAAARDAAKRRQRVSDVLARVVKSEVDEGLPFDEPKTEDGQQDGQLRPAWRRAYLDGRDRYTFNDDTYWVFDQRGRPHTPQVCIDFVTDTLERASGAYFRRRAEKREYVRGLLDFDAFGLDNRRSVETFVSFTRAHPEWFEFTETELSARVPFRERERFFRDVYEHRDEYRPYDIVTIFGLRSDGKLHYHSFFVADRDPVTGMPIAVVANAGRPRVRSWENEMQNAPQRAILAHIRPRLSWLEANVGLASDASVSAQENPGETGSAG